MTGQCRCDCGRAAYKLGLARTCYRRWVRWGRPEDVPQPYANGRRESRSKAGRMEDYFELRSWGEDLGSAAVRAGISERTAWRYEAGRRQCQEAQAVA